ncbi:MAG: diguanylate cyclase (GGDEF)-like protein [Paraglaciecola sp.]|jgi:diguanylate cyclase (GGDEF)-like protein
MTKSSKAKILIVDDEFINIEILNAGLSDKYQILRCDAAPSALMMAQIEQPDIILLDIGMPEMNGYQVCHALKENDLTRHIPVIFSSSLDTVEDEILGFEFGASDYITKPFNMQLVRLRVQNLLLLKQKTDLLEKLANLDGLTNIPNRRHFDAVFDAEWQRAKRRKQSVSVCLLDVDSFKQFNDHYGHVAGDKCLIDIANKLADSCRRGSDVVARYGGEEFVVLLPEGDSADARVFAEYLCKKIFSLGIKHDYSTCADVITVSVGVATVIPSDDVSREGLLTQADEQLYRAKKKGKNQVCFNDT